MGWGGVGRRGAGRGGAASCVFYEVRRLCDRSGEEPCQVSGACPGSLEAQLMTSDDTSLLVPNSHDSYENIMRTFSWKKDLLYHCYLAVQIIGLFECNTMIGCNEKKMPTRRARCR